MKKRRQPGLLALAAGVVLIGFLTGGLGLWAMGLPKQRIESQLRVGLTQEEIRQRLGEPELRYEADAAPDRYYVDGWAYREREITSEVWIFIVGEPICYVWFDEDDRVEDWFVGGS